MRWNKEIFRFAGSREFSCFCLVFFALWLGFPNNFLEAPLLILFWPLGCAFLGKFGANTKKALIAGWLATFFGAIPCLYWLYMPVHEVGDLHFAPAFACALLIAFAVASQSGLFSVGAYFAKNAHPALAAVFLGLLWWVLEYLYALIGGFPWLTPAASLAEWPFTLQIADIMGAYAADGLWICAVLLCALSLPKIYGKFLAGTFFCGLCVCALICGYGCVRLNLPEKSAEGIVNALFVEGNIDQNRKWEPAFQRETLEHYIALTENGLELAKKRDISQPLVIWPETALPFFYQLKPEFSQILRDFVKQENIPLLFGAPGVEYAPGKAEGAVYNRAFLLGPDGRLLGHYDKEHLVPFGEYAPAWLKLGFLEALLQGVGVYEPGQESAPLRYGRLALGMLICYEGIFPWLARDRVESGANILIDISNDGWFGRSAAARQHLLLTVPRCIEQNRWLLRATNTGISAVVDARGRVDMRGDVFQAGSILARADLEEKRSLYYYLASGLPFGAFAFLAICAWIIFKNRTGNRPQCCI